MVLARPVLNIKYNNLCAWHMVSPQKVAVPFIIFPEKNGVSKK